MARVPKPLFLARSSYRQRRLADAARAMPVFSAILLMLPLLWSAPADGSGSLDTDLGYLLVLWLAMIVVTAILARGLAPDADGDGDSPPRDLPSASRPRARPEAAPVAPGNG